MRAASIESNKTTFYYSFKISSQNRSLMEKGALNIKQVFLTSWLLRRGGKGAAILNSNLPNNFQESFTAPCILQSPTSK